MADTPLDPALAARLETLRRSLDLYLDAEGRWHHEGVQFEHARLAALFDRGIDVHSESGDPIVHVGDRWCYFRAADTPFLVRKLDVENDTLLATLNNSERHAVPQDGVTAAGTDIYMQLTPSRRARLDRYCVAALAEWLEEDESGALSLRVGAQRWPVTIKAG
jgi:hypothetical protein